MGIFWEFIKGGKGESSSFTWASLRVDDDTFASNDGGDGEGLDFGGFVVLDFLAEIGDPRGEIEFVERHLKI